MERDGYLICQQPTCLHPTPVILPGQPWHLGHDDTGTHYIGPVHARCNRIDGAVRGNRKSRGIETPIRWVI